MKETTFTIPEMFVTKTNFSFRMAVVAFHGTSNFSAPSPFFTTNSELNVIWHKLNEQYGVINRYNVYTIWRCISLQCFNSIALDIVTMFEQYGLIYRYNALTVSR